MFSAHNSQSFSQFQAYCSDRLRRKGNLSRISPKPNFSMSLAFLVWSPNNGKTITGFPRVALSIILPAPPWVMNSVRRSSAEIFSRKFSYDQHASMDPITLWTTFKIDHSCSIWPWISNWEGGLSESLERQRVGVRLPNKSPCGVHFERTKFSTPLKIASSISSYFHMNVVSGKLKHGTRLKESKSFPQFLMKLWRIKDSASR